jgi:hypothetical protein
VAKAYLSLSDITSFAVIAAATIAITCTHIGMGIISSPFKIRYFIKAL